MVYWHHTFKQLDNLLFAEYKSYLKEINNRYGYVNKYKRLNKFCQLFVKFLNVSCREWRDKYAIDIDVYMLY